MANDPQSTTPRERGFYWVQVPDMLPQIALYDPEEEGLGSHGEPWRFTWGSYRWPERIRVLSERLEPPHG